MSSYEKIREATNNFTAPIGLKVGKSKRYTRFLQPGIWDLAGKMMLRAKNSGRHISDASHEDKKGIESLVAGCDFCEY